jgi:hypothetical protein
MIKKHNILLVVRHPVGGIRTFFRYVYSNFDSDKYKFTLVAPDLPETGVLLDDLRELAVDYIPTDRNVSNKELFRIVTKIIRNQSFDLIHSHGFTSGACSSFGALFKRTPHILTCHEVLTQGQFIGLKGTLRKAGLGMMLAMVDCIHCVSNDARDNLLAYFPLLKRLKCKVAAISNGIDVDRFLHTERRDFRR